MTYKHDAIVRAWLDGKTIEHLNTYSGSWLPVPSYSTVGRVPRFVCSEQYRLLAEKRRYRVALRTDGVTESVDTLDDGITLEAGAWFERWLTDWIEY